MSLLQKKILLGLILLGLLSLAGLGIQGVCKNREKANYVFAQAYEDFQNHDYQNSYYLFKKVSLFSDLKPVALFHQGESAQNIEDYKSAIKQYQLVFNNYPNHELSAISMYRVAQLLYKDQPRLASKHFKKIIEQYPDTDYALASEYYLGCLLLSKYSDGELIFPKSAKSDVEKAFRNYLSKAPSGRFSLQVVEKWSKLEVEHNVDDLMLMANTYFLFDENEKAKELLDKIDIKENWAFGVKNSYAMKDYSQVRFLLKSGLKKYAQYVDEKDLINALEIYLSLEKSRYNAIEELLKNDFINGRDYLLSQKCSQIKLELREACYNELYLKYSKGNFAGDALSNIFFEKIRKNDYANAIKIGYDHLEKYPNINSSAKVLFWIGKIYEKNNDYTKYTQIYKDVIVKYPDSYYAYRAYIRLNHFDNSLISDIYQSKQVEFPYQYSKNSVVAKLIEFEDYDVLQEYYQDDDFVKSWILYEKGDLTHSTLVARDAIDKLVKKPDKHDLRWRLVYPLVFEEDIKKYSDLAKNNTLLMTSLVREESYFNKNAQSSVGARGLMQLMPQTAKEITKAYGISLKNIDKLFDEETNLKAGNYYYASLKRELNGNNIAAIASYNGGIGAYKNWQKKLNYEDIDEFIEQIPYLETQNYVKKIYRSYWNYLRLYQED